MNMVFFLAVLFMAVLLVGVRLVPPVSSGWAFYYGYVPQYVQRTVFGLFFSVTTSAAMGLVKLGQPVSDLYLSVEEKRGLPVTIST